jgi:hypothetical protein
VHRVSLSGVLGIEAGKAWPSNADRMVPALMGFTYLAWRCDRAGTGSKMINTGAGFSGSVWCVAPKVPIIVGATAVIAVKRTKQETVQCDRGCLQQLRDLGDPSGADLHAVDAWKHQ